MSILQQLDINQTLLIQFVIFAAFFAIVSPLFFKPFLKLIEERHRRTVADRKAAETLMLQANGKFEEYKAQLDAERRAMAQDYESMLKRAREEEARILASAREQAKKISEEAQAEITRHRDELRAKLDVEVESMANQLAEKIASGKTL